MKTAGLHRGRMWARAGLACLILGTLCGCTLALSKDKMVTKATPRYLDRYLKAKEGINAEERAMRMRLQKEIKSEDARLRTVAHVLSKKPAKAHGARLPEAVTATTDPTAARDFKTPPEKKKPVPVAHAARARSLARIAAKRRQHLKHLLGFAQKDRSKSQKIDTQASVVSTSQSKPARRQSALKKAAPVSKAQTALAAIKHRVQVAAFDIHTVRRFDPGQSLSFARELFATFALSYADTSLLTGYVGRDIVQLGHYYAMTRFGIYPQLLVRTLASTAAG